MAQWEEIGELCIEEEDIGEPCTLEDEVEELYATCDPIGEEPPPKVELKPLPPNLRTACKTPIGVSPFKLVFGKSCHLPVEYEHKAYWAISKLNLDENLAREKRLLKLNELEEFRMDAYENAKIYKERTNQTLVLSTPKISLYHTPLPNPRPSLRKYSIKASRLKLLLQFLSFLLMASRLHDCVINSWLMSDKTNVKTSQAPCAQLACSGHPQMGGHEFESQWRRSRN
nr:Pantetheine hydrolase [Ipomoea batatas]